jgi:DNA polymerase III epsilon subunit-like protein
MQMIFVDTETTGLDLDRHEVWEIGMVMADSDNPFTEPETALVRVEPTWMENADPGALRVNRYYSKTAHLRGTSRASGVDPTGETWSDPYSVAVYLCLLFENAIIVGNNPAFDEMFLAKFAREHSQTLAPFHRKINVVDMALQRCHDMASGNIKSDIPNLAEDATRLPHSSSKVLNAALCPANEDPHTAMGDAWHVYHAYLHLTGWSQ